LSLTSDLLNPPQEVTRRLENNKKNNNLTLLNLKNIMII